MNKTTWKDKETSTKLPTLIEPWQCFRINIRDYIDPDYYYILKEYADYVSQPDGSIFIFDKACLESFTRTQIDEVEIDLIKRILGFCPEECNKIITEWV